ncbi:MAG: radical SAM protein [Lachnospiraceae bacterium]|nr:radical SAM protein [Lachnospiraceae bacterium]
MSTRKDKRTEVRGGGCLAVSAGMPGKRLLMFVEREPDNLMAAAICCARLKEQHNITIQFTDRHGINYDITRYRGEPECDEIVIFCPSINEYSVIYLDRLNIPYRYAGSTTKLPQEYVNENITLTKKPVTELVCRYFGTEGKIFDEVKAYTTRYFPEDMELFDGIRYQYLCFGMSARDLFALFLEHVSQGRTELMLSDELNDKYHHTFEKQMGLIKKQIENGVRKEKDGQSFLFLNGGCPCTLLLNAAIRKTDCSVCVNSCMHRQHFTVLCKNGMQELFDKYISRFIYSGCGEYSGGGCFEKNCRDERFMDAFLEKYPIHGFYNDRLCGYSEFEPEEYEWIEDTGGITDKKIYKNFNFTIFVDSYCNADCKFCIEQIKTENTGCIEKRSLKNKEEYIAKLDAVLEKIRPLNPSVSITGGEPLLCPWFKDVLILLKKYQFRKTVITTNGSNILELVDDIADAGISHVNFSRPHFDPAVVQDIMRFKDPHFADYFGELREAIGKLQAKGVRTRFNCILTKNGINSVEMMKAYMDYVLSLDCHHVVFRELMSFNENIALNEEKKTYARDNRIAVNTLWKEIDGDKDFACVMNMQGHYYYIEIYEYKDLTMVSERANLKCLEDSYVKNEDYIYEMVFHPNGNLCAGWTEDKDVIM